MIFLRVLRTERMKLRRTFALKMAVLAPVAVVILLLFIASQSPYTLLRRTGLNDWVALAHVNFFFWGILMLPLYITLETSLVAGVDHAGNQWKSLFARPVPRWTTYIAKLIIVMAMAIFSTMILLTGVIASGTLLPHLQTEAKFEFPIPWVSLLRKSAQMTALGFLALTIQHWISLRWRSFAVSTGIGIVAMVVGYAMALASQPNGGLTQYYPWALPMLVLARWTVNLEAVLWISTMLGCAVTVVGCAEFCRRELE